MCGRGDSEPLPQHLERLHALHIIRRTFQVGRAQSGAEIGLTRAQEGSDERVETLRFLHHVEVRRQPAHFVPQSVQPILAAGAKQGIKMRHHLLVGQGAGYGSPARSRGTQILQIRSGRRGELQAVGKLAIGLQRPAAFARPNTQARQFQLRGFRMHQEDRAVFRRPVFQRRPIGHQGAGVKPADDPPNITVNDRLWRIPQIVRIEARGELPQRAIGHATMNCTLPLGGEVEIDADKGTLTVIGRREDR